MKPSTNGIVVKKERDVVVKTEIDIDKVPYESEMVQCLSVGVHIENLKEEKSKVIEELMTTKKENQRLQFMLQKKNQ